jgi:hypothetical protein
MKKGFRGLVFVSLLLTIAYIAIPAYSAATKEKTVGPVELGLTKTQVMKLLGKPDSPEKFDFYYEKSGIKLVVIFDEKSKGVESIIVRGESPKYAVGGIKVGDIKDMVKQNYGTPERIVKYKKSGVECWYYPSQNVNFAIRGGKVESFGVSSVTFLQKK